MAIPPFIPGHPASGETLGNTRDIIRNNLDALQKTQDVNHVAMNAAGQGKHRIIQMPTALSGASRPATAAGEIALFQRSVNGTNNLMWRRQNIAANGEDIQLTANIVPGTIAAVVTGGTGAPVASGNITFLPGNVFVLSGVVSGINLAVAPYKVEFASLTASTLFSVQLTSLAQSIGMSPVPTPFVVGNGINTTAPVSFNFVAILPSGFPAPASPRSISYTILGILA